MPNYKTAVYESPDPVMPLVAVILDGDEVVKAFTVLSVVEGELKLQMELRQLKYPTEAQLPESS